MHSDLYSVRDTAVNMVHLKWCEDHFNTYIYMVMHGGWIYIYFNFRSPRPAVVEPAEQFEDEDGLPEKLLQKTAQYYKYVFLH